MVKKFPFVRRNRTASIQLSAQTILEDASIGATIGVLSTINGSGTYTYTITSDPDNKFDISGSNLVTTATLNYDVATEHNVTIQANNGVDPPVSHLFTIGVINVEPPTTTVLTAYAGTADEITWTIEGALVEGTTWGTFWNGDIWIVGQRNILSKTPGWDGIKNGCMLDPAPQPNPGTATQGYDTRVGVSPIYSASLRQTYPFTIQPGSSLCSSIGLTTPTQTVLQTVAVLTCLSSAPAGTAFRPQYTAGTKTVYLISAANMALLPSVAVPAGQSVLALTGVMTKPWLDHGPRIYGRGIRPSHNMPDYGREIAQEAGWILIHACMNIAGAQDFAKRAIQAGIDLNGLLGNNADTWSNNGNHGFGRKGLILFAKILLGTSWIIPAGSGVIGGISGVETKKFQEEEYTYYGAVTGQYPGGKPLSGSADENLSGGNNWARDPAGVGEQPGLTPEGGDYRLTGSPVLVMTVLAMELLNLWTAWNWQAFRDYIIRWVNTPADWIDSSSAFTRDVYGYGGDGNGLNTALWTTYGPSGIPADSTAPTLSSPSGTQTGQTTATLAVTTDEGNGILYTVVTTSATLPSAAQVKAGQNNAGGAANFAANQTVASTGTKSFNATGLVASTQYWTYFMHEDAATNQSSVAAAISFTTAANSAPTYLEAGTYAGSNGATTRAPALSTNRANGDLIFAVVTSKNNFTHSWAGTGWTKGGQVNSGTGFTLSWGWAIASGTLAAPTITVASSNIACAAQSFTLRGNAALPIGASNSNAGTTSTHSCTGIITTRANSRVIYFDGAAANTALATPGTWTENADNGAGAGASRIVLGGKTVVSSGSASGDISVTGANAAWVMLQVEIKNP